MAVYAWQLALITILVAAPVIPLLRVMQRRQLRAYDEVRVAGRRDLVGEVSEAVQGAASIRAYGLQGRARHRLARWPSTASTGPR